MRVSLFSGVALAALIAAPAMAADMPIYTKAPPVMMAPFSWTGFYVGFNAGYGFSGSNSVTTTGQGAANIAAVADGARPGSISLDRDGFIGGVQIGYNWQFGNIVAGLEADIQYTDMRDSVNGITTLAVAGPNGTPPGTRNNVFNQELDYLGTVRGRLGYAWDRTLLYATGGLAYGGVNNSASFSGPLPAGVTQFTGSRRETEVGYTIGAGIEHAFGGNWSLKAEYLYYDLGDTTIAVNNVLGPAGAGGPGYDSTFRNDGHIVRAGLNYRFGR